MYPDSSPGLFQTTTLEASVPPTDGPTAFGALCVLLIKLYNNVTVLHNSAHVCHEAVHARSRRTFSSFITGTTSALHLYTEKQSPQI